MTSRSLQLALIGILLTTVVQSSCSARTSSQNTQIQNARQTTASDDEQLIREVEQFAGSDEPVSEAAWQTLQRRSRSTLIEDLTRISNASTTDDIHRVLIAFTFCKLGHGVSVQSKNNRLSIISEAKVR